MKKIKRGHYRHFKGKEYDVVGIAKHTETLEELVVYKPLYECGMTELWARPLDMFGDKKEVDGEDVQRFEYLGELKRPQLEVHVGTVCLHKGKLLILKRVGDKSLYPDLWECGGGKVAKGETFEEAVKREIEEEMGATVEIVKVVGFYSIAVPDREQKVIPGVRVVCRITDFLHDDEPKISAEHSEWRFIEKGEVNDFEFIPGLAEELMEVDWCDNK